MDVSKLYSKKSFGIISIFVLLISAGINVGLYFGIDWLFVYLSRDTGKEVASQNISWVVNNLEMLSTQFYLWVVPAVTGVLVLFGLLLWLILNRSMSKTSNGLSVEKGQGTSKEKSKKDFIDHKIEQDRKRRLFLHSLSVLQREGRLMDFFDEDLSLYDDEQIGAAVRSIQEDCKKAIKKYIDPRPVIETEEGDTVTIEQGFDIDAIKLVGNVAGSPPFEGILKHRGWKAGKKDIPKLSDIQDSTIIIPAEVEIQ